MNNIIKFYRQNLMLKLFKLNTYPNPLNLFNPDISSDEFSKYVSELRISGTSKTTINNRHKLTDKWIISYCKQLQNPTLRFLDIGASDGITSLNLIDSLANRFEMFFITDLVYHLFYTKGTIFTKLFSPLNLKCVLAANSFFGVKVQLLPKFIRSVFDRTDSKRMVEFELINPKVKALIKNNDKVTIKSYDVFSPWNHGNVDIIKVANLLTKSYFSDDQIRAALLNLQNYLNPNGIICIIHNQKDVERTTFLKLKNDKLNIIDKINGGVDLSNIVERE